MYFVQEAPGKLLAIPIVPMVNPKTNRVLTIKLDDDNDEDEDEDEDEGDEGTHRPLEEGETVLAVPVVGLVPHPIVPGRRFDEDYHEDDDDFVHDHI